MNKRDVTAAMSVIIDDPDLTTSHKVAHIFTLMGKLTPEPGSGNVRPKAVNYNSHLVRKVGRPKVVATPEQKIIARRILRELGML